MTDQPVCYLQEGDDPRDHDITDGILCARCYDALAEQVDAAAELFEDMLRSPLLSDETWTERMRGVVAMLRERQIVDPRFSAGLTPEIVAGLEYEDMLTDE